MSKTVAPVTIIAIGVTAVSASVVMAQSGPPPAPPPPPQIKSATVNCQMTDEAGGRFELSGQMGNWRLNNQNRPMLTLRVNAPENSGLSGDYAAFPSSPENYELSRLDRSNGASFTGFLSAGYDQKGMVMLKSSHFDRSTSRYVSRRVVGICETPVSPKELELPA